ncbi:MAG: outer membrane beta-barrel protein [Gemmatimonadota bacterium]|nr:outer membrane beta-barrel protein [Gemmatimonadota bacterium]
MAVNEKIASRLRWAWRVATAVRLAAAAALVALSWFAAPMAAHAQARDGFYFRGDVGDSDALTFRGSFKGVDLPTRCDRLLHPDPANVPRDPACTGFGPGVFATVRFDRGAETMTSATALALGYSRGRIRLEAELNNTALGGTSAPLLDAGRLAEETVQEWSTVEPPSARVSGLTVSDVFLNVHLDFDNSSRFTPFVGVGGGVSTVVLAFETLRVRRTLANGFVPEGGVDPATDTAIPAWQTRAAGTADYMSLLLAESTLGANLIGGLALAANERFSVALRWRYARYRDVQKPGKWDLLRSHAPVLEDGRRPVTFDLVLGDIAFYAVTVSLVYAF